jgi:hypothetical protein
MTGTRADTLLALMDRIEQFTMTRAWDALSDDEFFWEPATTTWSIRRRDRPGHVPRSEPANGWLTSRSPSPSRHP